MSQLEPIRDELLAAYEQAKALAGSIQPEGPSPATRARILQAARAAAVSASHENAIHSIASEPENMAGSGQKNLQNSVSVVASPQARSAANDSFWRIPAFASIALIGLTALLFWQLQHGTPEEQAAVKTATPATTSVAKTMPSSSSESTEASAPPSSKPAPEAQTAAANPLKLQSSAHARSAPGAAVRSKQVTPEAQVEPAESKAAAAAPVAPLPVPSAPAVEMPVALANPTPAHANDAPNTPSAASSQAPATARARVLAAPSASMKTDADGKAAQPEAASAARSASRKPEPTPAVSESTAFNSASPLPIFQAIAEQNEAALRQILRAQPQSANLRRADGQTPLHLAVQMRWRIGIALLISAGAKVEALDAQGQSPRDLASADEDLLRLLGQ